ncbi:histone H3.3C [Ceratitis capitata]|uniref:histone H3.3C n=1 Tax=Ceratitis capitata TaxID=7213 RepID=UPI00061880BC|nr:histone H3.3C [Ceratitis capitata]
MRPPRKIGPKSHKLKNAFSTKSSNQPTHPAADLGETDTSSSAEEDLQTDDQNFRSPTPEPNDTNYGLEFTHTGDHHIDNLSQGQAQSSKALANRLCENQIAKNISLGVGMQKSFATLSASVDPNKNVSQSATETEPILQTTPRKTSDKKQIKQKRKQKSNVKFLKSYKLLAARTDFMIARSAFARVVREIMLSMNTEVRYITETAFEALQVATEAYVEGRLEDANLLALHARRVTLMAKDLELINFLRANQR